jgi:acyl-CoA reductase-like NAD-dependent aldehyde dehydrogenase
MTDQTPVQAAAEALLPWWGPEYQAMREAQAHAALDAATQHVDALARVLLNEGAWCGLCDEPSWDCSECRPTVRRYAEAIRAHLLGGAS